LLTNAFIAYGHISVRNPQNPQTFFISKSLAPALVCSREDLEEYHVSDASPVNPDAPKAYAERFIHSEIYKRYKDVRSVVHSHSEAVLPYSIGSTPLRPVFHMGGVMGAQVPIYDIANHYKGSDNLHSMLVTNEHLGAGLATGFHPSTLSSKAVSMVKNYITSSTPQPVDYPQYPTVLMRGHGFTCIGESIEQAVYRAIYTCTNARVQTTALLMQGTHNLQLVGERFGAAEGERGPAKHEDIKYLSDREAKDAWTANQGHAERPWKLWCAEVANSSLYTNDLGLPPGA
jgi:ribulose-5-phosphate 4-epimerase/fuculose-1-phosphate aldolase